MTTLWVLLAVLITGSVLWALFTAQRLNRLHIRCDTARCAVQAALDRRAAVVAVLHPELAALAKQAETVSLYPGDFHEREQSERALMAAVANPIQHPELVDAQVRVQLAVRFYNDAVTDTRQLRLRPIVRVLHLGGGAPLPVFCELAEPLNG